MAEYETAAYAAYNDSAAYADEGAAPAAYGEQVRVAEALREERLKLSDRTAAVPAPMDGARSLAPARDACAHAGGLRRRRAPSRPSQLPKPCYC